MKEKARDLMVRNKFIASQQSCDLRWHLDSATPETSIVDIVDSCRIWESHAEPITVKHRCQDTVYRKPKLLMPPPATDSSVFTVESVMPTSDESTRRWSHSSADRELLIRNVLETMATRRDIISGRQRNTEPEYLEEIVKGSHPSLGDACRELLPDLLFRYRHVFPALGEPVTGCAMLRRRSRG